MSQTMIIEEVLARPQEVSWLPWAVQYFFFIGIAACAALFGCLLHWRKRHDAKLERLTLLIALTCAITAPLALTADLHQAARFWHFYAYPTPWSWMPWGALFLPLFTLFLGLWFAVRQRLCCWPSSWRSGSAVIPFPARLFVSGWSFRLQPVITRSAGWHAGLFH